MLPDFESSQGKKLWNVLEECREKPYTQFLLVKPDNSKVRNYVRTQGERKRKVFSLFFSLFVLNTQIRSDFSASKQQPRKQNKPIKRC